MPKMLILSWNVAGWSQTIKRIAADYPVSSASSSSSSSSGATSSSTSNASNNKLRGQPITDYLTRHGADIVCIQESKIPLSQLSSRSEPLCCSTIPGYESFWCPNAAADPSKRGFNGVLTYAKTGMVSRADCRPLGSSELDDQGRCLMTDHGSFVLFNVYVPAGGGNPLSYKMKFLNALRSAMKRQREAGRHVILTGDLNIAHRRDDVHWKYRVVDVEAVLEEVRDCKTKGSVADMHKWKMDLHDNWDQLQSVLGTMEVVPVTTKNTKTGQTFDKFRVRVSTGDASNKRYVFLGRAESSEEEAKYYYDFQGGTYFDEDLQEERVARKANCICLEMLMELMSKIVRIEWNDDTRRLIASTGADVKHASPTIQWLSSIIDEDGMVDTFRHFYPDAKDRFTCWHQYTNKRFENEGCRIDYMLVDGPLLQHVERGNEEPIRCCNFEGDPLSEEAALHAATASNNFQGSSFEGGGIAAASQHALDTQFGEPHTGIVYTPPSYSDHVATSLLFKDSFGDKSLDLDESDAATKKAQPHKTQKSIASFFGKKPSGGLSSQKSSGSAKSRSSIGISGVENVFQRSSSTGSDGKRKPGQQSIASSFSKRSKGNTSSNASRGGNTGAAATKSSAKQPKKPKPGSIMSHFAKRSK